MLIVISLLVLLYFRKGVEKKKIVYAFLASVIMLSFLQIKTTNFKNLGYLDNDEQRVQQMRLKEYPPVKVSLFNKSLWIPIAHWFEERKEVIIFYRLEENFFQAIDLNLYFFSNHPRERIGVSEFEKFTYPLLPFFLIGVFAYFKERKYLLVGIIFLSLILISIIGFSNSLGPFLLFPFISIAIYLGLENTYTKIKKWGKLKSISIITIFLMFCVLSFIQLLAYATK